MTNKDVNMHYRFMCIFMGLMEYYNNQVKPNYIL